MSRLDVAPWISTHLARGAQEAAMFTGAIIMQRRWRLAGPVESGRGRLMDRGMRATPQSRGVKTYARQDALRCRDVVGLAAVRGASERKLSRGKAVVLGR